MKINIAPFESQLKLREETAKKLSLPENIRLDFALDGIHGVNETIRGLLELYPHKRSIAVLGAQPAPLDQIVKQVAKQGYIVQELPIDLLKPQPEQKTALLAAMEQLKKDTLFILSATAEPFTGIFYPIDLIKEEIFKKNIFLIQYQSPAVLSEGLRRPQSNLESIIYDPFWDEAVSLALVLKGERCLGEKVIWGESAYNILAVEKLVKNFKAKPVKLSSKKILDFEKKLSQKFSHKIKTLPLHTLRLFDRAVFFVSGVNGDAIVHELSKKKIVASTSDSCYWNNPGLNTWLPKLGFTVEDSQTCVVLEPNVKAEKIFSSFLGAP